MEKGRRHTAISHILGENLHHNCIYNGLDGRDICVHLIHLLFQGSNTALQRTVLGIQILNVLLQVSVIVTTVCE